jgi:hypothetical protein
LLLLWGLLGDLLLRLLLGLLMWLLELEVPVDLVGGVPGFDGGAVSLCDAFVEVLLHLAQFLCKLAAFLQDKVKNYVFFFDTSYKFVNILTP